VDGDGDLDNGNSSSSTTGKTEKSLRSTFMEAGFLATLRGFTLPEQEQEDYRMKSRAEADAKSVLGR
jgi:hypothetical protein